MFWEKWLNKSNSNTPQKPKLRSPGEIPHQIGRHLVVNLQKNPDWVWNLKAALKRLKAEKNQHVWFAFSIRSKPPTEA